MKELATINEALDWRAKITGTIAELRRTSSHPILMLDLATNLDDIDTELMELIPKEITKTINEYYGTARIY